MSRNDYHLRGSRIAVVVGEGGETRTSRAAGWPGPPPVTLEGEGGFEEEHRVRTATTCSRTDGSRDVEENDGTGWMLVRPPVEGPPSKGPSAGELTVAAGRRTRDARRTSGTEAGRNGRTGQDWIGVLSTS